MHPIFFRGVLTIIIQPQSTRGRENLSGLGSHYLRTGLSRPGQCWQGGKGDSRDTSTIVTSCPIRMSFPADSSCEGRVSLHFAQPGLSMPAAAGVVDEKGSEYILTHTGPRKFTGTTRGGVLLCFIDPRVRKIRNEASSCPGIFSRTLHFYCGSGFGLVPGYTTL